MKFKWNDYRAGLLIVIVVLIAMMMFPASEVREIRNTDHFSNFAMADPRPGSSDWPWWRGSEGRNVAVTAGIPLDWSASGNDRWQTAVPGRGDSTPCLWGDQLFLLASDERAQRISLQSHSRATGQTVWRTELHQGGMIATTDKGSGLSTSPACDGQFIYSAAVVHETLWITSVDMKGRVAWQRPAGPFSSSKPYRPSPTLYKSLIIVAADQESGSYIAALHRQTGEIIWRLRREKGDNATSPVVATIGGRSQLILCGRGAVTSYDPATGAEFWKFRWPANSVLSTVAFDQEHVIAISHLPNPEVVCVRADGEGDVTQTHLVWRQPKIGSGIPSPVCHGGLIYVLADDGRLTCLEVGAGKVVWRKRLEGNFTSSPVIAGQFLICCSESGQSTILRADTSGIVVAENKLPDGISATPIVAGNSVFLRTRGNMHCITSSTVEPVVEKPNPSKRRI